MILSIMMPIDEEGDFLRPAYKQKQGYNLGRSKKHVEDLGLDPKLTRKIFDNYFEAVLHLYTMSKPWWRRPNSLGNFGAVTNKKGWSEVQINIDELSISKTELNLISELKEKSNQIKTTSVRKSSKKTTKFPLKAAYEFLALKGYDLTVSQLKKYKHFDEKNKDSGVRRAIMVYWLVNNELMNEFVLFEPSPENKEQAWYQNPNKAAHNHEIKFRLNMYQKLFSLVDKLDPTETPSLLEINQVFSTEKDLTDNETNIEQQFDSVLSDEKVNLLFSKLSSRSHQPVKREVSSASYERDAALSWILKKKYNHSCQVCGIQIKLPHGNFYVEGHHIVPLSEGGVDALSNMICVCPNCHIKFHKHAIEWDFSERLIVDQIVRENHKLSINYHL